MAQTYQMLWDCPSCDTRKLLGLSHRHCPACGAPQDAARRYFPEAAERVAFENHPFHGADRVCAGCGTPNAGTAAFCVNCGAPTEGAPEVRRVPSKRAERWAPVAHRDRHAETLARLEAVPWARLAGSGASALLSLALRPPGVAAAKARVFRWGCALLVVGMLLPCGAWRFWTRDVDLTLTGHTWERAIDIQTMRTEERSGWKESVPASARHVTCTPRQRSSTTVDVGSRTCSTVSRDNGDGTFDLVEECSSTSTRTEVVMDDYCSYTEDVWSTVYTARNTGDGVEPPPSWPSFSLAAGEREANASGRYTLLFLETGGAARSCGVSEGRWGALSDGSTWRAPVGVLSGRLDCDALVAR